jgi:hypothetical protein
MAIRTLADFKQHGEFHLQMLVTADATPENDAKLMKGLSDKISDYQHLRWLSIAALAAACFAVLFSGIQLASMCTLFAHGVAAASAPVSAGICFIACCFLLRLSYQSYNQHGVLYHWVKALDHDIQHVPGFLANQRAALATEIRNLPIP